MRSAPAWVLSLSGLLSIVTAACTCPDSSFQGLRIQGIAAQGNTTNFDYGVRLTVTQQASDGSLGKSIIVDGDPFSRFGAIPSGRYRLVGTVKGVAIGPLDNVCTIGDRTGCAAADTADSESAMVEIREGNVGEYSMSLTRNGKCP
jgi:hypothetical protein